MARIENGTAPYSYNWTDLTPPPTEPKDRSGLAPGTYSVTVTDVNGCTATLSKTITQPTALSLSVAITHPSCETEPPPFDGAINLTVTGGTPFPSPPLYSYDWNDIPGSHDSEDRTGLGPGTYAIIVTDANGCTANISATLVAVSGTPNPPAQINH